MRGSGRANEMQGGDPQGARPERRRTTIGYLAPAIHGGSLDQWIGVVDAAQKHDVNLICFPGASPNFPTGFEVQANILYDLVGAENVDGLVTWASAIGNYMSGEEIQAFHERYRPLPMVSVGRVLEGIPGLLMDSYEGMREAIVHLIEVHGCRRVAFIRGPEGHFYAQERYRAYLETLGTYGLPFDPSLVTPPSMWGKDRGAEGMRLLLDERKRNPGTDFEAVVAANDEMIIGAWDVLQARGVRVPRDVAVVGFDDRLEGRARTPPLTSVVSPFYEAGYQSVEMLLALMEGKQVPVETIVPSRLVIRQSCGCLESAVVQAAVDLAEGSSEPLESVLASRREKALSAMVQAIGEFSENGARNWAERLWGGFVGELQGEAAEPFLLTLDGVLRQMAVAGGDVSAWQGVLSALRRQTAPYLKGEALRRAENLWQQARVMIGETVRREQVHQHLQVSRQADALRDIGSALVFTSDLEGLLDVLVESLSRLGIRSCHLALYEDPQPYRYPQPVPEWSRLVLAYDGADALHPGRVELEPGRRRFRSSQLVPEKAWLQERPLILVVEPLYFQEHQLGFVLFEASLRDGALYDALSMQISGALQRARLLEEHGQAEEALLEERNLLRTLIDALPDSVYVKDAESRFIIANAEATRRLGAMTPEQVVGKTDMELYPERLATGYSADEQELFRAGRPLINREELVIDQTTGDRIWNLATKVPLRDSQGKIVALVGIGRNISQRKLAEEALERRSAQLQTAAEVSKVSNSTLDLDELIQQVVELAQERFDLYYVGLFLVDGEWAVLRAATGEAGKKMLRQGHKLQVGGDSMIGQCVGDHRARIALDVGEEAVRFDNPLLPETRSEMALPLVSREGAIGALSIQSAQETAFSEEDVTVFKTMADQLANAIANARLYEKVQK
ncbi:MAG: substrate-binding domain-containing protein, partial [Anaerolineae bacterium]|nr:substrate-binding domain-containing protein [Anaerolineae bacterium]